MAALIELRCQRFLTPDFVPVAVPQFWSNELERRWRVNSLFRRQEFKPQAVSFGIVHEHKASAMTCSICRFLAKELTKQLDPDATSISAVQAKIGIFNLLAPSDEIVAISGLLVAVAIRS